MEGNKKTKKTNQKKQTENKRSINSTMTMTYKILSPSMAFALWLSAVQTKDHFSHEIESL
jgi:hypothetical protein